MSVDANAEFLEFRNVDKIKFIGTSSNTIIDTTTGRLGIGTDTPAYAIDVRGTANVTALSGITDFNFQPTSNTASIEYDSNVVTGFNRSKKLIKYPRVALTGSTSGGYTASASVDDSVNDRVAWKAFNSVYPRSLSTDFWYSGASGNYNGGTTGREYDGSTNLGSDSGRTATDSGEWLQINLPNKIQLTEFKVWGQPNTINNHPAGGVLYARNTINEDWTELHVFDETRISVSNTNYTHELSITPSYYNTYALVIKKVSQSNPGTTGVSVGELELFGIPEYDPDAAGVDVKVTSYPNVPNTDWLEVYYDAKNYTSGNNVQDETANNRDGVLYGNTSFSSADGIHKFDFDGSGDYIESLNITSISGNQTMSSSVWVKFTSWNNTTYDFIYSLGDRTVSGNGTEYTLSVDHQVNGLYIGTNGLAGTAATRFIPDLGRWYHFATTYDGDTNRIFIDGTLRNSESLIGDLNLPTSGCDLVLGGDTASSRGQFMNGSIANFRLFNRALTSDEVWQLYAYQKEYFGHGDLGMTLKAGRLGIGTSEPRAALEVMGDIVASSPVYFYLGIDDDSHVAATTKIPFHLIRANKGGGYDTETYNFTAPIGGWYWMAFGGNNRSASSVLHMSLKDGPNSSDTTLLMAYDRPSGQSLMHAHRSGLVYIREGGIVSLWVTSSTVDAGNGFGGASVEWGGFLVSREFQGEN
jgi:hypothetical protein